MMLALRRLLLGQRKHSASPQVQAEQYASAVKEQLCARMPPYAQAYVQFNAKHLAAAYEAGYAAAQRDGG